MSNPRVAVPAFHFGLHRVAVLAILASGGGGLCCQWATSCAMSQSLLVGIACRKGEYRTATFRVCK